MVAACLVGTGSPPTHAPAQILGHRSGGGGRCGGGAGERSVGGTTGREHTKQTGGTNRATGRRKDAGERTKTTTAKNTAAAAIQTILTV